MPAHRNAPSRRSRRLSKQEPRNYDEDVWENCYGLAYPSPASDNTISSSSPPYSAVSTVAPSPSPPPRTSHSRRRQNGHIARPPNAFMLFRSDFWANEKLKVQPIERDHRDISRIAAHCWNSLGDEGKLKYQQLAEKKKQLHRLEHPDYKYAPVFRKEKTVKRKLKRDTEDEEDRCRKLATLVMGGVPAAALGEAMKKIDNESRATIAQPAFHPRPRRRVSGRAAPRARTPVPMEPFIKVESPPAPVLIYDALDVRLDEGFVPTEEIPPLDLSFAVKKEELSENTWDPTLRPLGYDTIDSQFGFKPELAHFARDTCFWYTSDGSIVGDELLSTPLPSLLSQHAYDLDHFSPHFPVEFTNPFNYSGLEAVFVEHQQAFGDFTSSAATLPTDNFSIGNSHESDMDQYFRFDGC